MNAKMKKGVSIREHVLNMINLMHEAEIHRATIDERTQVSIILESLTPAFSQFTTSYVMNKLQYNMTQLLNERSKEPLQLVQSNACSPLSVQARGGYEYFVTFVDDYSRYGYVYLMHKKSELLES